MIKPNCPRCSAAQNRNVPMDFVPGAIGQTPEGIQIRQVFCPLCSYQPPPGPSGEPQWWAPFKVHQNKCTACGHVDQRKEYYRGGVPGIPTPVSENVFVDGNGYAHGLGVQGIPVV